MVVRGTLESGASLPIYLHENKSDGRWSYTPVRWGIQGVAMVWSGLGAVAETVFTLHGYSVAGF